MSNTIELAENKFQPLPTGKYVFTVQDIKYDPAFQRVDMKLATETGRTLFQTFYFMTKDDRPNDVQRSLFSRMAKAAMNDKNLKNVDPDLLMGKSFKAEVTHTVLPSKTNPNDTVTFVNLKNYEPAENKAAELSDDELKAFLG